MSILKLENLVMPPAECLSYFQILQGGSLMEGEFQDETIVCLDCGKEFVFTANEQAFYKEKGLLNKPKRCAECRRQRKQNIQNNNQKREF